MRICLLEDDLVLGRSLQAVLQRDHHEVVWVRRLAEARQQLAEAAPDALLLDLGLPDGQGLSLLREIRARDSQLPVLVITARDGIEDRLQGLDEGADDYLIKPFVGAELLARLRAVTRRSGRALAPEEPQLWSVRDLVLDEGRQQLSRAGQTIALSKTEFALLLTLMKYPDRVLTRAELESRALARSEGAALDVHMFNLRRKIGEGYVRTVRGVGFVLEKA